MGRFYYVELYKLLRRKDVFWSLLIAICVPLLFGLLAKTGSSMLTIRGDKFSALEYAILILEFLRGLLFLYFIFIIFTSSSLAGELEKGNLSLLLIRSESRVKVIMAKLFALITILIFFIISISFSSIVNYYIFLYNTKFVTNEFLRDGFLAILYDPFVLIFQVSLIIVITELLSLFFNNYQANLISMGLIILMKVLERVDKIKKFIPTYLWSIAEKTEHEIIIKSLQNIGLLGVYISIVLIVTFYYFSKMDIKN